MLVKHMPFFLYCANFFFECTGLYWSTLYEYVELISLHGGNSLLLFPIAFSPKTRQTPKAKCKILLSICKCSYVQPPQPRMKT